MTNDMLDTLLDELDGAAFEQADQGSDVVVARKNAIKDHVQSLLQAAVEAEREATLALLENEVKAFISARGTNRVSAVVVSTLRRLHDRINHEDHLPKVTPAGHGEHER